MYLVFYTASVHPAKMGTRCTGPRLDQELQAAVRPQPGKVKSEEHVQSQGYLDSNTDNFTFTFIV